MVDPDEGGAEMIGLITGPGEFGGSDTTFMSHAVQGPALAAVQTAAALCVAMYAVNSCGRGRRSTRRSLVQLVVLVVLAALGAAWVVQAAAGISIFAFGSVVFGRLSKVRRRLLVSSLAILVFAVLGASWVLYPFAALAAVRAMNLLGSGGARTGRNRCGDRYRGEEPVPVDLRKSPAETEYAVPPRMVTQPDITAYVDDIRVPAAAAELVREIVARSTAAAEYLAQQGRSSGVDALEVERIREDYAPEAVRGYLALPPWSADDTVLVDGKTGAQLLLEQLQLLARRLQGIQESVALSGGEQLRTHGAFLRDRFPSEPGGPLSL